MDLNNLQKELNKIDKNLHVYCDQYHFPKEMWIDHGNGSDQIYDFTTQKFNEENCLKYIPDKIHTLNALLDAYYADKLEIPADSEEQVDTTDKDVAKAKLIKDMKEWLANIDEDFELVTNSDDPIKIVLDRYDVRTFIYNFQLKNFIYDNLKYITKPEFYALQNVVNDYWKKRIELNIDTAINTSQNPFKKYTDHLADVLKAKNDAYGDSFSKSVDTYGLSTIGIRLSDKYNRIENLITENIFSENGESLQDTLLDNAGYSILALKYLEDRRNEN